MMHLLLLFPKYVTCLLLEDFMQHVWHIFQMITWHICHYYFQSTWLICC